LGNLNPSYGQHRVEEFYPETKRFGGLFERFRKHGVSQLGMTSTNLHKTLGFYLRFRHAGFGNPVRLRGQHRVERIHRQDLPLVGRRFWTVYASQAGKSAVNSLFVIFAFQV
jgi:hypothetical protein